LARLRPGKHAGKACRVCSPTWYGRVKGKPVALCSNKTAAETMLTDLIRNHERQDVGLVNPFESQSRRPLADHLADFRSTLLGKGDTVHHADLVVTRVRRVAEGFGFSFLRDLDASKATAWLADQSALSAIQLSEGKDAFTIAEVAQLLGIKCASVSATVRRFGLASTARGKTTRLSRAIVE
jgi:hypothetical protein